MDRLDKLIKENKNNIEVSEKVHQRLEDTLNIIKNDTNQEEQKIKLEKRKTKINFKKAVLVASITLVTLISVGIKFDVYAKFGDLMKKFEKQGDVPEKVELYTNVIEKSIEDNGYKVNIECIMADSHTIRLFYDIASEKNEKQKPGIWGEKMLINDKNFSEYGWISGEGHDVQDDNKKWSGNMLVLRFEKELPKNFNFKWNINNISKQEGKWNFNINVDGEKIAKETIVKDVNKDGKLQFADFKVNKVEASPVELKVQGEQIINDSTVKILGDRQQNFDWYGIKYIVVDEDNKILPLATGDFCEWWNGGQYKKNYTWSYKVKNKIPNKIKIIPCDKLEIFGNNSHEYDQFDVGEKDIPLYEGKNGGLDIKSIEDKGDFLEVNVKIKGYLRFELLNSLVLIKSDDKNKVYPEESCFSEESRKYINENLDKEEHKLKFYKFDGKSKKYSIRFKAGHKGSYIDKIYRVYEDKFIDVDLNK
ncbi:protein of unknown function [Clostridium cavendishii DSM 21758]|uniref:DUF4179 domain-containing protein n=1 Tax=Clostridium cavendishii DSM 21758 TaxID=1121302 RepID=A0A1M6I913_9CLOT|nr:DUF4179 domain-containing protein [Clostridium cavendishii]SHJ30915.1 protein of unknown function [Clostridium cavendishii DSM 21758]